MRRRIVMALSVMAACTPDAPPQSELPVLTDSAGTRIASYGTLYDWAEGPTVSEVLRIGLVDGPDEELFSRLAGGVILADGGIVLADAESREVRQFDPSGAFLGAHGREGEGPGEYKFITGMGRCRPEGFTVFDIGWTMSFYDGQGAFIEEEPTRLEGGRTPYHLACHASGMLAVINWDLTGPQLGFHTATGRLRLLAPNGTEWVDLGERIGSERVGHSGGSGPHPAGRSTQFGFSGDDLIVTDGSFFGFERWAPTGALSEIVRIEADPPSLDSLMQAYLEWTLTRATSDAQRAAWRSQVEDMEGPARASYFSDLFVTDELILVREPTIGESGRWFSFHADGTPAGFLPLPDGSKFLDASGGHVLVQEVGELDVPVAVLYRLEWAEDPEARH